LHGRLFAKSRFGQRHIVHVLDIGYDNGNQVLAKSASLQGYSFLTAWVKQNIAAGMTQDMAIRQAVDHCIQNGMLSDFLRDNFEEVLKVLNYEYDAELERRVLMEEGLERGREEGKIEGREEGKIEGREEGREEGKIEGREEGKIEGREEGKIEVAKNLLSMNMTVDQVVSATGLSREEVEGLQ
jgi:predicted transposase/invertase (TIGR01784 family)